MGFLEAFYWIVVASDLLQIVDKVKRNDA